MSTRQSVESRFVTHFGERSLRALRLIASGKSSNREFSTRSIAAYRANLTRGAYAPFVTVRTSGKLAGSMRLA